MAEEAGVPVAVVYMNVAGSECESNRKVVHTCVCVCYCLFVCICSLSHTAWHLCVCTCMHNDTCTCNYCQMYLSSHCAISTLD